MIASVRVSVREFGSGTDAREPPPHDDSMQVHQKEQLAREAACASPTNKKASGHGKGDVGQSSPTYSESNSDIDAKKRKKNFAQDAVVETEGIVSQSMDSSYDCSDKLQTPTCSEQPAQKATKSASLTQTEGNNTTPGHAEILRSAKTMKRTADSMRDSCGRHKPICLHYYVCSCLKYVHYAICLHSGRGSDRPQNGETSSSSVATIFSQTLNLLEYCVKVSRGLANPGDRRTKRLRAAVAISQSVFHALITICRMKLWLMRRKTVRMEYTRLQEIDDTEKDVWSLQEAFTEIVDETMPALESQPRAWLSLSHAKGLIANVGSSKESDILHKLYESTVDLNHLVRIDDIIDKSVQSFAPLKELLEV